MAGNLGLLHRQPAMMAACSAAALVALLAAAPYPQSGRRAWIPGPAAEPDEPAPPYPPDALPGGRSVQTPYGAIRVFEWGPEDGERVLLLHGIATPCVALGAVAAELVDRAACRVMLFDLFGRGYSDAPADPPYDMRLYTAQILLVLASSHLPWTGDEAFHLVGYSLGGGLAASFASYFPRMLRSLTMVAGGGLIRRAHVGWRSKVLYSTGWLPERFLQWLVARRLAPAIQEEEEKGEEGEEEPEQEKQDTKADAEVAPQRNSDASGGRSFDHAVLPAGATVSAVIAWQLRRHLGFVPAFMSTIRHAPIYEEREDWHRLGRLLAERRAPHPPPGLVGGQVLLVLGRTDPVIVKDELLHDAAEALGPHGFRAVVLEAGHEVVMTRGAEVAAAAMQFWEDNRTTDAVHVAAV